jgi:serine/threonine-protein kinase
MGEVYRGQDTRLKRDVALKLLPASVANDADRLLRFEREAQMLAALNHPHIAGIYGVEEADGTRALVMELVEGETLADRLSSGPIPLEDALPIAQQIVDALEAAHEAGIVHRDLKPANIKIRPDGTVKVLDFGLAKAVDPPAHAISPVGAPTITSPVMTRAGTVLGSAAYMSPEQARGKVVDRRADIWAFGCVLYEMFSGAMAFPGDNITDVLAAVVKSEPDWTALPPDTPSSIRRLLRRCLQKDPKVRLRDIGDARLELERGADHQGGTTVTEQGDAPRRIRRMTIVAAGFGVVSFVLLGLLVAGYPRGDQAPQLPVHLSVTFPDTAQMHLSLPRPSLAVSPDGRRIVYTAAGPEGPQLWMRELDQFAPRPIPGTRNGRMAAFSPDGRWVAFFADNQLKKISISTGPPVVLCPAVAGFGATWTAADEIVFALGGAAGDDMGLWRVTAAGGERRKVVSESAMEPRSSSFMGYPDALPDGRRVLVTMDNPGAATSSDLTIGMVDLASGQVTRLLEGAVTARYARTGHLIYLRAGELFAAPFNVATATLGDERVPVVSGLYYDPSVPVGNFALSASGTLAYIPGDDSHFRLGLMAAGADGSRPLIDERRHYGAARVSPDGRRVAALLRALFGEIWTIDLSRGAFTKLPTTTPRVQPFNPVWSHDGRYVFAGLGGLAGDDSYGIVRMPSDGSGGEEPLTTSPGLQTPNAVTPDGASLVFTEVRPEAGADLLLVSLVDRRTQPLLATRFGESAAALSPDGRWIAYQSNRSGRVEVYVAQFPSMASPIPVSTSGGTNPAWSRDGRRLYYNRGGYAANIEVVDVTPGASLQLSRPQPFGQFSVADPSFDVLPDGRLLLISGSGNDGSTPELRVIVNWFDELRRSLATRAP